jgi:dihydropteroate synthase
MRIIRVDNRDSLAQLMREIKVDPYGIEIMAPKALAYVIKINSLPSIQANILKQEMLSLGGDVAVTRDALSGKAKDTDCLLIGNLAQYRGLSGKLKRQPFGLSRLAPESSALIAGYQKEGFRLNLGRYRLASANGRTLIWGIMNLTPDSFSGDGLGKIKDLGYALEFAEAMIADGADLIDLGGESTRPGARPVSLKEELARVIPVIRKIAKKIKVPISIDTYKPAVAEAALGCGASLINDIRGLSDPQMLRLAARKKCGVTIMHCKGNPRTMQDKPEYRALIDEVIDYLRKAVIRAQDAGVAGDKIIVDPGIGFGKTAEHNLQILRRLNEFKVLGKPILVGVSRKSFIGKILGLPAQERLYGTIAAAVLAAGNGASFLRVHDVKAVAQAIKIANSINKDRMP